MARQRISNGEALIDFQFPFEGVEAVRAFNRQRQGTTYDAQNVVTFDPRTDRARGASRSGMAKFFTGPATTAAMPIQDIYDLVSTTLPPNITLGLFAYSQGSGNGFGAGLTASGASSFSSVGAVSGFQLACTCWGEGNDLYVAEVNTTTGAVRIYSITTAGAITWTNTALTVDTGSLRNLAGMVLIGAYLFVARVTTNAPYTTGQPQCRITRMVAATGSVDADQWRIANGTFQLYFSTSSVNCLGRCGTILGVDVVGSTANSAGFNTFESTSAPVTSGAGNIGGVAYGGTANHSKTHVCSDGQTFFVIASNTTNQVKRIGLNNRVLWSYTSSENFNGLAYDLSTGALVALSATAPSLRQINPNTGVLITTFTPGSGTLWDEIDSDSRGNWVLWKNSVASNDVMGLGSSLGSQWGPSTLANVDHSGCTVNKGTPQQVHTDTNNRAIRPMLMSGGELRHYATTGTTAITGGAVFNQSVKAIYSAQCGLDVFFADGQGWYYYDNDTNTVLAWTLTAGTFPTEFPRLIENWRGRIVIAGFRSNPQLYYAFKQLDPFDLDISPATTTSTQAFSGTTDGFGYPGQKINCIIPYKDDTCLFGDDHAIWQLTGDPAAGGQFDLVTDSIGMAWGRPWCKDPSGQIYFFSTGAGIWKMSPNTLPMRISQQIQKRLEDVDLSANLIRMCWDVREQCLRVYITPTDPEEETTHYIFEERTQGWWPVRFANVEHNPYAVYVSDADDPNDRRVLLGGNTGNLFQLGRDYTTDAGTEIESYVLIPLQNREGDYLKLETLQEATFSEGTGTVYFEVYAGDTAEDALANVDAGRYVEHGQFGGGRNYVQPIRKGGISIIVKLHSTDSWALERIAARFSTHGPVRRRL